MYSLGIDIGTSGTKTVLFDIHGNAVASDAQTYPLYQPQNGWAEQEPSDWWNASASSIRNVLEISGINPSEICGVGLSGQMHGLVMLDSDNKPLRKSIIWCDQRTAEECVEIEQRVGKKRLIEITANPALPGFTASKILWVRNHEPEIFKKCRHILLPKDYVRFMLTGVYATEVSDASGMQLLDIPNRCWSKEVLARLDIDEDLLAKVYESPEITGKISEKAAQITGLKAGTPVVGGAGDNAAAAVGTGVVKSGKAFTTIGTSGVVFLHTDEVKIDLKGRVHTFCCAVPGKWHMMGVTQAAGLSLKWFKDNFCQDISAKAESDGVSVYSIINSMAASSPIGANRLLFLPYLMGERTPHLDSNARGTFFGISAMHTKSDFLRAIMEGVSFSLNDCLSVFSECGFTPTEMMACGGGGTSELWRQMLSDIYGCPVTTVKSQEGPALGVAILAMVGAGVYPSVEAACEAVIKSDVVQYPDFEAHKKYERNYTLYRSLYPTLKETFSALAEL
jgi:xylulokinase